METQQQTARSAGHQLPFVARHAAIPPGIKLKLVGLAIKQVFKAMNGSVKCDINIRNYSDTPLIIHGPALHHGKPAPGEAGEVINPLRAREEENVGVQNVSSGLYGPFGFVLLSDEAGRWEKVAVIPFEVPYGQGFPTFFNCYCNAQWVSRSDATISAYLSDPSGDNIKAVMDKYYKEYQSHADRWKGKVVSAQIGNSDESVLAVSLWEPAQL